jgi:hypothetical protein
LARISKDPSGEVVGNLTVAQFLFAHHGIVLKDVHIRRSSPKASKLIVHSIAARDRAGPPHHAVLPMPTGREPEGSSGPIHIVGGAIMLRSLAAQRPAGDMLSPIQRVVTAGVEPKLRSEFSLPTV